MHVRLELLTPLLLRPLLLGSAVLPILLLLLRGTLRSPLIRRVRLSVPLRLCAAFEKFVETHLRRILRLRTVSILLRNTLVLGFVFGHLNEISEFVVVVRTVHCVVLLHCHMETRIVLLWHFVFVRRSENVVVQQIETVVLRSDILR